MSVTTSIVKCAVTLAAFVTLAACGSGNESAPTVDPVRGKHPASWVYGHRAYFHSNETQCNDCHGSDLRGGITRIDCFNQTNDTRCHADNHAPRDITHPLPFMDKSLHGPWAQADLIGCQACHGEPGIEGTNPNFNLPIGDLPQGCEGCHDHPNGAAHPTAGDSSGATGWAGHRLAGGDLLRCDICHGMNLGGIAANGNASAGRSCAAAGCHTSLAPGTVPVAGQCMSCHGKPPNGTATPNTEGAHVRHNNLTTVNSHCEICHGGAGSGSPLHSNGNVDITFLTSHDAKSGAATIDHSTHTCSNIRCHGGRDIAWTGTFDTDAHCEQCHDLGTDQYNGYHSGEHQRHTPGGAAGTPCTDCHDLDKLRPTHFSNLSSIEFDVDPADTIIDEVNYTGGTCSPQNDGSQSVFFLNRCHFTNPQPW